MKVPKRVWRAKIRMVYEEPEALLNTSRDLDWLLKKHGRDIILKTRNLNCLETI